MAEAERSGVYDPANAILGRKISYPSSVDEQLVQYVLREQQNGVLVQPDMIRKEAKHLITPYCHDFKASTGWLDKFLSRNKLSLYPPKEKPVQMASRERQFEKDSDYDDDDEDDDDDVDDRKDENGMAANVNPERLKAFNMFVRLFVDENLDRLVPISKQPKEKINAIIMSCQRQFPEFGERARKRIRTYLKSCRRSTRLRDTNTKISMTHIPASQLTEVNNILAQACQNETNEAAKRQRIDAKTHVSSGGVSGGGSVLAADKSSKPPQAQKILLEHIVNSATGGRVANEKRKASQGIAVHPSFIPSSVKEPLLKISGTELSSVRALIAGYRQSAAYLTRSADELEELLKNCQAFPDEAVKTETVTGGITLPEPNSKDSSVLPTAEKDGIKSERGEAEDHKMVARKRKHDDELPLRTPVKYPVEIPKANLQQNTSAETSNSVKTTKIDKVVEPVQQNSILVHHQPHHAPVKIQELPHQQQAPRLSVTVKQQQPTTHEIKLKPATLLPHEGATMTALIPVDHTQAAIALPNKILLASPQRAVPLEKVSLQPARTSTQPTTIRPLQQATLVQIQPGPQQKSPARFTTVPQQNIIEIFNVKSPPSRIQGTPIIAQPLNVLSNQFSTRPPQQLKTLQPILPHTRAMFHTVVHSSQQTTTNPQQTQNRLHHTQASSTSQVQHHQATNQQTSSSQENQQQQHKHHQQIQQSPQPTNNPSRQITFSSQPSPQHSSNMENSNTHRQYPTNSGGVVQQMYLIHSTSANNINQPPQQSPHQTVNNSRQQTQQQQPAIFNFEPANQPPQYARVSSHPSSINYNNSPVGSPLLHQHQQNRHMSPPAPNNMENTMKNNRHPSMSGDYVSHHNFYDNR
ncbi:nuclear factor of activated T-cells 5-like [Clytia hemisphaerica]|uniref:HTH CENPB-type domain-containing protein n=1 Tax=Clytia hemisphaerica TaxID=252671 RepID=A0A7M6DJE3_9CNID